MANTTAERQAAYRARQAHGGVDGNGQRRVSLWLSSGGALALQRLADRYGVTQRELVERMVLAEDERVLATIASDSPDWDSYFNRKSSSAISKVGRRPSAMTDVVPSRPTNHASSLVLAPTAAIPDPSVRITASGPRSSSFLIGVLEQTLQELVFMF